MMKKFKKFWWRIPAAIRKPFVLVVGLLFIIASVLTGWLPGPGGVPLFLIGIAILATEFAWAKRVRDKVIHVVERAGRMYKCHPVWGTILLLLFAVAAFTIGYSVWKLVR